VLFSLMPRRDDQATSAKLGRVGEREQCLSQPDATSSAQASICGQSESEDETGVRGMAGKVDESSQVSWGA